MIGRFDRGNRQSEEIFLIRHQGRCRNGARKAARSNLKAEMVVFGGEGTVLLGNIIRRVRAGFVDPLSTTPH